MKGGCFGHIMSFVFGVIVGIVLLVGTVAGVVYYGVSELTINKVEEISKTKLEFIDDSAKIRDKSLLDIIGDLKSGEFKKTYTLEKIQEDFGIDFLKTLEKTLGMTLREEGKADVRTIPVMELFQGDNPKRIINCLGLRSVLEKAGVDMSNLEDKPLVADYLDDPVMDGFNGMMGELKFDELTIGDIQYLLGVSFGGGVLDNFRNDRLSDMADAINEVTVENLDPNFSRDTYIRIGDDRYRSDGYVSVTMADAYERIPAAETVPEEDRYSFNESKGTVSKDKEGEYRLKPAYAGLELSCEDFFVKEGDETYVSRRHGRYVPTDGDAVAPKFVKAEDRFAPASEGGGYEPSRTGQFYEKFSPSPSGTYQRSYVRNFITEGGTVSLERRGMVPVSEYNTGADGKFYKIETAPDGGHELVAAGDGEYCLREGESPRIMQNLADMTLNTFDQDIKNIKVKDMMEIEPSYVMEKCEAGEEGTLYVTLNKEGRTYAGTYLTGHTPDSAEELLFVRYKEGLSPEYFGTQLYKIVTEAASGFMIRLGEKTLEEMEDGLDADIDATALGEVMDIDGDVFVRVDAVRKYEDIPSGEDPLNYYVYTDEKKDILRTMSAEDTEDRDVYKKIYEGNGNAVIKKMFGMKIGDIGGGRVDAVIDDTRLGEIMTITDDSPRILRKLKNSSIKKLDQDIKEVQLKDIMEIESENVVEKDPDGLYVALKKGSPAPYKYAGSYIKGHTADDPDTELLLVKWHDGIVEDDYHTVERYKITKEAASGLMVTLGDKTVGGLEGGLQSDVDDTALGDVIDIDGDVFVLTEHANHAAVMAADPDNVLDYYVYSDGQKDMLRTIGPEDTADTEVYKKIHDGKGNAVIKKMFGLKIKDIGGERMNDIVNETRIGEVLADEIREYYEIVENDAGEYIALPALAEGEEYVGTYKIGRVAGGAENILFVKYQDGNMGPGTDFAGLQRYDIAQDADGNKLEQSSGTLIGLKNKKIGDLGKSEGGMKNVVDESLMSDVIDIDGNVYKAIEAADYAAAHGELGDGNVYYKDGEYGLYLNADGVLEADRASLSAPFYRLVYEGKSNALLRKFAVLSVSDLGNSAAINAAVKDCRLSDFITAEEGTFLFRIKDSRIGTIEKDAEKILQDATLSELNKWGDLGLTGLNKTITVDGVEQTIGDMNVKDFLQYAIDALTGP